MHSTTIFSSAIELAASVVATPLVQSNIENRFSGGWCGTHVRANSIPNRVDIYVYDSAQLLVWPQVGVVADADDNVRDSSGFSLGLPQTFTAKSTPVCLTTVAMS
jgi:hypothetical protein